MSAPITRHWRELVAVTVIIVASAVCGSDATAQKNQGPPNALQGFSQNRDEPVKIRATALEIREKDNIATFTGDVYVLQGDTEMRCNVLVVSYEKETGTRTANVAEPGPGGDRQNPSHRGQRQRRCGSKGSKCNRGCCHLQHEREHRDARRQCHRHSGHECSTWPAAGGRSHQRGVKDGWRPNRRHISIGATNLS
jgi:LptA/(LptD N-terminal domain) LPS transport protein